MARRRIATEATSRLAIWARRVGLFSLAAAVLSIIILRAGFLEVEPALATFGGALALAVIAILLSFAAFVVIWKDGLAGIGYAVSAILISLALLAYPAYLAIRAYKLPAIADVTTDPVDPPRFEVVARLRPRGTVTYAGLYAAEQQRRAYPEIEPLLTSASPQTTYEAVYALMTKRKWRIVDARPPEGTRRDGHVEAVARSPIMGFRDDIVVRIRPAPDGARVDIRSASRYACFGHYGCHDLGANATRVRALIDDIDDATSVPDDDKPAGKPAPKRPPIVKSRGNQPAARR